MKQMLYRNLTAEEIADLENRGCTAESWENVQVSCSFSTEYMRNVSFSGSVRLGSFDRFHELGGGMRKHAGLYNVSLSNVTVENDVLLEDVGFIANYEIGEGARICRVGRMYVRPDARFGNGVRVNVLSETGGREVTIYEHLSAQTAYMLSLYRYRPAFISGLQTLIEQEISSLSSSVGTIGEDSLIEDVTSVIDVKIGPCAEISGALLLENGTVVSAKEAVSRIGHGVVCRNFIVQTDSSVSDAAVVNNCFIGQGCIVSNGYSASDSLFFANSHLENGESAALFAGPYTVSHHKSTLLIGTQFSFMNAGSATNFSNHLYKLGPMHQGIFARGTKCASGSYMMLPVKVGAFTMIMGHHTSHVDTSDFPFSYLVEKEGRTKLIPGINLVNAGLFRDAGKWPDRDRRSPLHRRLDAVIFDLLSPCTWSSMKRGLSRLQDLECRLPEEGGSLECGGCILEAKSIRRGIELYSMALLEYPLSLLVKIMKEEGIDNLRDRFCDLKEDSSVGDWADLSGLIVPLEEVKALIASVEQGQKKDIFAFEAALHTLYADYRRAVERWLPSALPEDLVQSGFSAESLQKYVSVWKKCAVRRLGKISEDLAKEFSAPMCTGFGADGNEGDRAEDVLRVRGDMNADPLYQSIENRMSDIEKSVF